MWAWLVGPYRRRVPAACIRATSRARASASPGSSTHQSEAGIGTISEIFDAEQPYTPRGCIAQAWSVAEVLRAWLKTEAR